MNFSDESFGLLTLFAVFLAVAGVLCGWFMVTAVRRLRHSTRRVRRIRRLAAARCSRCDYDLRGALVDQCPECGHRFTRQEYRRLTSFWNFLYRGGGT